MHPDKDTIPKNSKGEFHGYCESYYFDGKLYWKGVFINGLRYGYFECYNKDGSIGKNSTGYWSKGEYISNDNPQGYCLIWNKENRLNA